MSAIRLPYVAAIVCVLVGLSVQEAAAGSAETAQIKSRQAKFRDIGGAFKAINDELKKGRIDWDNTVAPNVQTIKNYTAYVPNWFPKGSGPESGIKTYALPAIWQKNADFMKLAKAAQAESVKLDQAAASKDRNALRTQTESMGKACKACHDTYRSPDFEKNNDE